MQFSTANNAAAAVVVGPINMQIVEIIFAFENFTFYAQSKAK